MAEVFAVAIVGTDTPDTLLAYGEDRDEAKAQLEQYYGDYRESYRFREFAEGEEVEFVEFLKDNHRIRMQGDAQMYVDYADWQNSSLLDIESWERTADDAYRGRYDTAGEFAEEYAEESAEGRIDTGRWPYTYVDWEKAAADVFRYDFYRSDNGYVWRVQ